MGLTSLGGHQSSSSIGGRQDEKVERCILTTRSTGFLAGEMPRCLMQHMSLTCANKKIFGERKNTCGNLVLSPACSRDHNL
jgi:hypothetical protein